MKKTLVIFSMILVTFSLVACGKTNNVKVSIEKSESFSEEEINDAVETVKTHFRDFNGCTLTDTWYTEDESNKIVDDYLEYGGGLENGSAKENTIGLMSNFTTDSHGGDGSLNPNSTYNNWIWILTRENKNSNWKVQDAGF